MPTIEVRDVQGGVLEERELPEELFGGPVNTAVMHQEVVAGLAAQRAGTHSTKTRGEVSGGGVKPWRQKGTGRARHGSIRSPIWAGGGVAHGPKPRDYAQRVNKKMKKASLRSALSDASASGKLAVVGGLAFDEPKTKEAIGVLDALGLQGRVLLVLAEPDEFVEKSFRNLSGVRIDYAGNLSTYDLLYADRVLFTEEALDALTGEESGKRPARARRTKAEEEAAEAGAEGAGTAEAREAEGARSGGADQTDTGESSDASSGDPAEPEDGEDEAAEDDEGETAEDAEEEE
jgi:large subunit ribosomal protein L4